MTFWTMKTRGDTIVCCDECALYNTNQAVAIAKLLADNIRPGMGDKVAGPWESMRAAALDVALLSAVTGSDMDLIESEFGVCSACGAAFDGAA